MECAANTACGRFPGEESLAVFAGGHVREDGAGCACDCADVSEELDEMTTTLLGGRGRNACQVRLQFGSDQKVELPRGVSFDQLLSQANNDRLLVHVWLEENCRVGIALSCVDVAVNVHRAWSQLPHMATRYWS